MTTLLIAFAAEFVGPYYSGACARPLARLAVLTRTMAAYRREAAAARVEGRPAFPLPR